MRRFLIAAGAVTTAAILVLLPAASGAQPAAPLAGVWTLNRSLSEFPREIGFNVDWIPAPDSGQRTGSSSGGRGRRGSGGNRGDDRPAPTSRESYDDARRVQLLTAEIRNPPVRLMLVDTPAAVTITNELGQSRTLHPDGKQESIEIQGVPIPVTTKRDGSQLVVTYRVEEHRDVRYTYSHSASPSQLIVDVQLLDHGAGDKARRIYEPGVATETAASPPPAGAAAPASSRRDPAAAFDARPGAELKGLKSLGILVEELSPQAIACGLNHDSLETALWKRLADAGFTVRKNSDEDTYVYVNVMAATVASGACLSRYDAFLYTHATANLSYRDQPVLVQVSLMHRGGLGTSAATVVRGLENFIDLFVTQIRDANK
jgi:hypothetical protein